MAVFHPLAIAADPGILIAPQQNQADHCGKHNQDNNNYFFEYNFIYTKFLFISYFLFLIS